MIDRQIEDIIPKVIAQKCPVCNGFGTLKYGEIVCHACKGRGYILIPNEIEREKYDTPKT